MTAPTSILDLAMGADGALDTEEAARRTEQAAKIVERFSAATAGPALEAVLAATESSDHAPAAQAKSVAHTVTEQTEVLLREVERFLSLASPRT